MTKKLYYVVACKHGHLRTAAPHKVPGVFTNKKKAERLLRKCERLNLDYMCYVAWQWATKDGRIEIDKLPAINLEHVYCGGYTTPKREFPIEWNNSDV